MHVTRVLPPVNVNCIPDEVHCIPDEWRIERRRMDVTTSERELCTGRVAHREKEDGVLLPANVNCIPDEWRIERRRMECYHQRT